MSRLKLVVGCILAVLAGLGGEAFAGGVTFSEQGAAATGKANAFAGEANDPSAIFYNPAGITQLPGTQVMVGTSIVYLDTVFRSGTTGESTQLQDQFPIVPHFSFPVAGEFPATRAGRPVSPVRPPSSDPARRGRAFSRHTQELAGSICLSRRMPG